MKHLHHNGVVVPQRYEGKGLSLKVNGKTLQLTSEQEEMALAWARKIGTPYVEDPVFAKNFHRDLSRKLGAEVRAEDIDYSEILFSIEQERNLKTKMSKADIRQLTAQRKATREENKETYGYAWVDDVRIEIANYVVEPNSIFMGRGKHPLRGSWKEGPRQEDIELNLSPDSPKPPGNWKSISWQPEAMWIARWQDKLSGKIKYVWFSDSSIQKQRKDIEKFNKARELRENLIQVESHIWNNLDSADVKRKKTATVCFLIDKLRIRVGDEKDPDEADTVGASTLRQEHLIYNDDGTVTFNFLGKDSVPHIFTVELPENVIRNLKEFSATTSATLFDGADSKSVSQFLGEVMDGLSAKVFRTCYASEAVNTKLTTAQVKPEDPECMKKYVATRANLEAAKVCNHRRTLPKNWKLSMEKDASRLNALKKRATETQTTLKEKARAQEQRLNERLRKHEKKLQMMIENLDGYLHRFENIRNQGKSLRAVTKSIKRQREMIKRQKILLKELGLEQERRKIKLRQNLSSRSQRDKMLIDGLSLRILTRKETSGYNLVTSLKSYIDPRIYYEWGKKVEYDWKQYYPKTLQKKFNWVDAGVYEHSRESATVASAPDTIYT